MGWLLAVLLYVVDGDTLHTNHGRIRLVCVDTPEMNTREGERAKNFVIEKLPAGSQILIKPHYQDHYGRTVATVRIGDHTLQRLLLDSGNAVRIEKYCAPYQD